jgi:predicted  nucleic acid-binding Zn-ribbon protein
MTNDEQITALMKQNLELREGIKDLENQVGAFEAEVEELKKELKLAREAFREIEQIASRCS